MSSDASIDAYFQRINFAGSIAPTLSTLEQLHVLHTAAIPFENLTPLMRLPVRLELRNLEQKLLFEKRGGYCIEHNLLFKAMLEDLGFPVQAHGARVLWGHPEDSERPVSHLVLTVDVGGVTYLADTVLLLRYFEAAGRVRRAISVIKKRAGNHEDTIREYRITPGGIEIGEPLSGFHGVLRGVPDFTGSDDPLLGDGPA